MQKWVFGYDYFKDPAYSSYSESKRLQLKSLQEMNCTEADTIPAYRFDYIADENVDGSDFMPHRLNKNIDHWGYYSYNVSGVNNNNYLLNVPPITTCDPFTASIGQSNRDPNADVMEMGTLEAIHYPTGGAVFFTYEPHSVYAPDDYYQQTVFEAVYAELPPGCYDDPPYSPGYDCCPTDFDNTDIGSEVIALNEIQIATGGITLQLSGRDVEDCLEEAVSFYVVLNIYDPDTNLIFTTNINGTIGNDPNPYEQSFDGLNISDPGNYTFELVLYGRAQAELQLYSITTTSLSNQNVGGLRIKEIRNSVDDTSSDDDIIRTFEYTKKDAPSESSGSLNGIPEYRLCTDRIVFRTDGFPYPYLPYPIKFLEVKDISITPMGNADGRHIVYDHVIEYFGPTSDKMRNGRIEHNYILDPFNGFTYSKPPVARLKDGLLASKKIYDKDDNLIQEDTIAYIEPPYIDMFDGDLVYQAMYLPVSCPTIPIVVPQFVTYRPKTAPHFNRTYRNST
ncbi:MAG: hypothetical protein IPJ74_08580 [Saprospiraceae bacterium]|nr:hypothetical protein [Saprospiraceae bacterium]